MDVMVSPRTLSSMLNLSRVSEVVSWSLEMAVLVR